jgi:DAK2 domain fusion protein YloV
MVKAIGGADFRKMIIAGGKLLENNKNNVNELNVFPVPDGDTGTNMSMTMLSAVKEMLACQTNDIEALCGALSMGALRGARGNSGVILSQIFRGVTETLKTESEITSRSFAKAFKNGTDVAYKAVSKPQEGTMLTIIRAVAEASESARRKSELPAFFKEVIEHAEEVLAQTPEMLPVLKKAGVVDAGGYGLVVLLKGFLKSVMGEEIQGDDTVEVAAPGGKKSEENFEIDLSNLEEIKFAYCTEFFIVRLHKKTTLADIEHLKEKLENIGDSVLAVGDLEFIKVHVHTNKPSQALGYGLELGELDNLKIENMLQQNRALVAKMESERKPAGMLAISAGKGLTAIFKDLQVDKIVEGGQSMNPSAEEIAQGANRVNAETVIVLPNNKNIILAAEQAKTLVTNKKLVVIPTKNIPQGLAAALAFNPDCSTEENVRNMQNAIPGVKSGQVTYAVRSTNIDGLRLKEGDIIGLDGSRVLNKGDSIPKVTAELIEKMKTENDEIITLYYGEGVREKDAEQFAEQLRERYPECEIDVHAGSQPVYYYLLSLE